MVNQGIEGEMSVLDVFIIEVQEKILHISQLYQICMMASVEKYVNISCKRLYRRDTYCDRIIKLGIIENFLTEDLYIACQFYDEHKHFHFPFDKLIINHLRSINSQFIRVPESG